MCVCVCVENMLLQRTGHKLSNLRGPLLVTNIDNSDDNYFSYSIYINK